MPRQSVFDMPFSKVYGCFVAKAERKGRTKAEVDEVTAWLTGYGNVDAIGDMTYGQFLSSAPAWNPGAELITGSICGVRVETIQDPMEKKMRQLDKLVDDLAKGKPIEKVLYRLDRIERVKKYERLFDEALISHDPEKLALLETYYTSGQWSDDYEADERGELPPDLKRGVLSQDGLYDLLERTRSP